MTTSALFKGLVLKLLPTPFTDDREDDKPVRLGRYGEQLAQVLYGPSRHGLAEEGSYLVAYNPTVSTGMTQVAAQTAFSDTTPNFYIYNNENPANQYAKSIYIDYIKMIATAAATAATAIHYALVLDVTARSLTTDNTQSLTVGNPNGAVANGIISPTIKWQNSATASVIAASSSNARRVGRGVLGGLNIAGDEMIIVSGSTDVGAHPGLTAAQASAVSRRVSTCPAIVLGPGDSLTGHFWAPSSSASWNPEVEIGFWAR